MRTASGQLYFSVDELEHALVLCGTPSKKGDYKKEALTDSVLSCTVLICSVHK